MNKEQSVFIRLEPEMKQTLKTLAEDKGLNISTYCRMILFEKMKEIKKDFNKLRSTPLNGEIK